MYAGESPRSDYEVVMAAIMDEETAIDDDSNNLKRDDKFILDAVIINPRVLGAEEINKKTSEF